MAPSHNLSFKRLLIHIIHTIAAARALMDIPELSAEDVARKAMRVASDMCVYTNDNYRVEVIQTNDAATDEKISSGAEQ